MAALCASIGRLLARCSDTPEKLSASDASVGTLPQPGAESDSAYAAVTRFSILEEKRMDMTFVVRFRVMAVAAALPVVFGACSTPPALPVAPVAAEPALVVQQVAAPVPELSPAQAKAQAQKLAIEAADELQNGDETAARLTLEKALGLDATNELARKLSEQIRADAQKELGPVFFRYTVQRDDSLSKLAQQYLGRPVPFLHPCQVQRHEQSRATGRGAGDQDSGPRARCGGGGGAGGPGQAAGSDRDGRAAAGRRCRGKAARRRGRGAAPRARARGQRQLRSRVCGDERCGSAFSGQRCGERASATRRAWR